MRRRKRRGEKGKIGGMRREKEKEEIKEEEGRVGGKERIKEERKNRRGGGKERGRNEEERMERMRTHCTVHNLFSLIFILVLVAVIMI